MLALLFAVWITGAQTAAPPAVNLEHAVNAARGLPRIHSLLVSRRGELILERYFNGAKPTSLANIKSASKTVISALVGIAIQRGSIANVKQTISSFFPEQLAAEKDARKKAITIENLLT